MDQVNETDIILNGLYRDRQDLAKRLADVERLIKKIKLGKFSFDTGNPNEAVNVDVVTTSNEPTENKPVDFPLRGELRVQVICVMDMIGIACKLRDIQEKYKELTGLRPNLRETTRNLSKHKILRLLRPKGSERGLYWVKEEWLECEGTKLKEQHKFEGFNLL